MSGTIPPIPPHIETNTGPPQLLDSRGSSHVTNVPNFDVDDISSWKDRNTKIVALRLKFNAFKALEGEKVQGTYTRLKVLLNDLENKGVSIPQVEASSSKALISNTQFPDNDSDVEEDTRSSSEFLADLNVEFHDRSLLSNQKRYYKRSGRVGSAKKPIDKTKETCFACGKLGHFQKDCPSTKNSIPSYPSSNKSYSKPKFQSNSTPQHNQSVDKYQKDYKGKCKGLKAVIAILTKKIDSLSKGKSDKGLGAESFDWDEELVSSEDEGVTKVQRLLSMTDGDERKNVLDYTHVDLHYVEDQRKSLLSKFNSLNQELSSWENDAQMLINKMENKMMYVPNFTFHYKVENSELVAIFWANEVAKCNYKKFRDIVSFDATFKINKYNMVFVPFTSIDNHKKYVTLGSGMILHKDTESYT
ncbi:retrovirus-related pol polyprotein from transposon TNT 1-94 [Tanacetum coccineum]